MTDVLSLSCQELVELVTDYLEHALEPGELARFEAHLSHCGGCTAYLEQMRQTVRATSALSVDTLPPAVEEELLQLFRSWQR